MANNSVSDEETATSSWNLSASNVVLFEEETGIIPLPAEDETDGHISLAAAQPMLVSLSAAEPLVSRSSSGPVYAALSVSSQRHVTPAVDKREAPVADIPMVCVFVVVCALGIALIDFQFWVDIICDIIT